MPTTRKYAEDTKVPVEKSRLDIELMLKRYGATHIGHMSSPDLEEIGFVINKFVFKILLPMPADGSMQLIKQRWRALLLVTKAKLEAIECGICTIEEAFLADMVVPNTGQTVYEQLRGQIETMQSTGQPPRLMIGSK